MAAYQRPLLADERPPPAPSVDLPSADLAPAPRAARPPLGTVEAAAALDR